MARRTFVFWLLVLLHGSIALEVNSPEASSGGEEGEQVPSPGAPSGGEEGEEEGERWAFPVGPPPAPPLPPRSPIGAATALPLAACGSKTPERAIREGDLIAFDFDWWNSRGCPVVAPGEMPPSPDEPPLDQLLYDKRLELDRSKLNILVYEGSTGGDFGLLHTLKPHADVIDQVAAAFDTVPTIGRCQSLTAWAPKFHNETGIHLKVHCWNFIGYEAKLLRAQSQSSCLPELAPYTGNFYVIGHTFDNFMCGEPASRDGIWTHASRFPFNPLSAPSSLWTAIPNVQRAMTRGLFGGMDAYDIPSTYALDPGYRAVHTIEGGDFFEDLNPYFAKGLAPGATIDPPLVDVQGGMLPILRDAYLTSGDALIGIPHTLNAVHLVHQPEHVQLAEVSSWDEYIAELLRLDGVDRDGDGVGDKPFCLPSSANSWALYLLEIIVGSFFQIAGPQDVRHFDLADAKMASTLNTPAMTEALRVFRQIWMLTDLTFDATAYKTGACVAGLSPVMREQPHSPNTVVGTPHVHAKGGALVPCTQANCPRALVSTGGSFVNPVPFLVLGCVHYSIDQRSLLKDEAWALLSFLHHPEVQFSMLTQGKALPALSSQFDSTAWRRSLDVLSGLTPLHTPLEAAALQTLTTPEKVANLKAWPGLEAWLGRAEAEVNDPQSAALFLSSQQAFWAESAELMMSGAIDAVTCRNSWDGFGVCLSAHGEYNDGEPNLITDAQYKQFLDGGPAAYMTVGHQVTRLKLTQQFGAIMDAQDAGAGKVGYSWNGSPIKMAARAGRLRELRSIFKLPTQKALATPEVSTPPGLRCGSSLGAAFLQCATPGYYARSLCGSICEPCPAGFRAEISYQGPHVSKNMSTGNGTYTTTTTDLIRTCSRCPINTYQSAPGKLGCVDCVNPLYGTGRSGATSKDECSVPTFEYRPTLPLGCLPPACVDKPTPVDVFWHLLGTSSPEPEAKTVRLRLYMETSWSDPRIALHPLVGTLLNDRIIQEGGVRKLTLTTSQWRQYGLWLPGYNVKHAASGVSGVLNHDNDARLSNITLIQSRLNVGQGREWPSQLFSIECVWSRFIGTDSQDAVMNWANLDWYMYPFGTNTMKIDVTCKQEANCTFHRQSKLGMYSYIEAEAENNSSHVIGRRLTTAARVTVTVAAQIEGGGEFPEDMPLVKDSVTTGMENGNATYRITFTLERSSTLQVVRLVIPTVLIMVLGVCVFFVADSTWTMEMTFNVLLVLSVISVEVKAFFPSHVTYLSWVDWFVVGNLLLIVSLSFLGLVCIVASESESEMKQKLGAKLDEAISQTQPIAALVFNVALICAGMIGGGPAAFNGPGPGSRIEAVQSIFFTFFVADVLVLVLAIAVKSEKGTGGFFMRQRARFSRGGVAHPEKLPTAPPTRV
jgi:hypothetical protein